MSLTLPRRGTGRTAKPDHGSRTGSQSPPATSHADCSRPLAVTKTARWPVQDRSDPRYNGFIGRCEEVAETTKGKEQMALTIRKPHEFIEAPDGHPKWRRELRTVLLDDEFLKLPGAFSFSICCFADG